MPIDRNGDHRLEALYNGLGDDAPRPWPPRRAKARRRGPWRRDLIIGGMTATLGLGILAGVLAQPELTDVKLAASAWPEALARKPLGRELIAPGLVAPELVAPELIAPELIAPELVASQPPLAATEPEPEAAAPAFTGAPPQIARRQVPAAPAPPPPLPETGGVLKLPPEMTPTAAAATPQRGPAPQPTASFDCAAVGPSAAEGIVCSDPQLAAADRELAQAYGRALRSGGADPKHLDLDQQDWSALREAAAHHSRQALASAYAQRIRKLNEIADSGSGGGGRP